MDIQRSSPSRGRRHNSSSVPFVLRKFECELRDALGYADDVREPGIPGSTPTDFTGSTSRVAVSWLFSNLLSKYDDGDKSKHAERHAAAMSKFWEAEEKCFWSNLRFSQDPDVLVKEEPRLVKARAYIHALLGQEFPYAEMGRELGHGKGSTTRVSKAYGNSVWKYSTSVEVTPNAQALASAAVLADPTWKRVFALGEGEFPSFKTTWGNCVLTIPKNYKTNRVIAVEPDMNMYVQKGIGGVIRRRLKRVGVDLNDQTLNQSAAWDLSNATIDFSMASDLVSQGLVNFLLPPNWRDLIAMARSEMGVFEGRLHRYSKVSSMGNGFTFELESLIFWALAAAVLPEDMVGRIRVYGDDVILPAEYAEAYMELCRYCGFIPNSDKSFWQGLFRESCGTHYYDECDITPFYIKEPVTTGDQLFLLHNNLWRWVSRMSGIIEDDKREKVLKILEKLRSLHPNSKWRKPRIPDGYGDGAFIGNFDECDPKSDPDGWDRVYRIEVRLPRTVSHPNAEDLDDGALVKAERAIARRSRLHRKVWLYELPMRVVPEVEKGFRPGYIRVPWGAWAG